MVKTKQTNNDVQNTTQKTKDACIFKKKNICTNA